MVITSKGIGNMTKRVGGGLFTLFRKGENMKESGKMTSLFRGLWKAWLMNQPHFQWYSFNFISSQTVFQLELAEPESVISLPPRKRDN
jgi:hypothetical protein